MSRLVGKRVTACAVLLLAGCSGPLVNVSPVPPTGYSEAGRTSGQACGLLFFSLIPFGVNDRVERAYVRALDEKDATALTDTSITERWFFGLVGPVVCTEVEGLAIRRVDGALPSPLDSR